MNTRPLVSFVIATYNRKKELKEAIESILRQKYRPIEIIVVDNGSTDGTAQMIAREFSGLPFLKYERLEKNLGAALGKNAGIKRAKGEIVVIMDDDAELAEPSAVEKIVERFRQDEKVGLLSLKSINFFTGKIDRKEFPHRDKSLSAEEEFETSYFVGVGHAVRREVFEKAGFYPSYSPYYGEELDLSFRILDAGYKIIYFPRATVLHKVSPRGRITGSKYWEKTLENRIKTSLRNLPWRYVLISSVIWTLFVLAKARGNLLVVLRAYRAITRDFRQLLAERRVIKGETIKKIKKLKGRLYY